MIPEFINGEFLLTKIHYGSDQYWLWKYFNMKNNPGEYFNCTFAELLDDPTYDDKLDMLKIETISCLELSLYEEQIFNNNYDPEDE